MTLVTIGMPVYNGAANIERAIRSLLQQTHTDFKLLVSDNGSSDSTAEIVLRLQQEDSRIEFFQQKSNLGAAPNFRYVLDHSAHSEYFMWAAHDDRWSPEFIETLVSDLDSDPTFGVAACGYMTVSDGMPFWQFHEPKNPLYSIQLVSADERVVEFSKPKATTHKDNLVYGLWRRKALEAVLVEWFQYPFAQTVIGGAMCQLALARYRGSFNTKIMFFKHYAGVAPGHPLEKPYRDTMGIKARMRGVKPGAPFDRESYVGAIATVLRGAGISEQAIQRVREVHE